METEYQTKLNQTYTGERTPFMGNKGGRITLKTGNCSAAIVTVARAIAGWNLTCSRDWLHAKPLNLMGII